MPEYQVVLMDPTKRAYHQPQTPLLETDRLDEACGFCYEKFKKDGIDIGVWQERSQGYREHYRKNPLPEPEPSGTEKYVVFWTARTSYLRVRSMFRDFDNIEKAREFRDSMQSKYQYNDTYRGYSVSNVSTNFGS